MMKRYDSTSIVLGVIGLAMAATGALLIALVANDVMATKTVLETFPGTKSICVATRYDYSVKHTVCTAYNSVPATCTKTDVDGPIFSRFESTNCK